MISNMNRSLADNLESLLATAAEQFTNEGAASEVAILANAEPNLQWIGEDWGVDCYWLYLQIPGWLFSLVSSNVEDCQSRILQKAQELLLPYEGKLQGLDISPILSSHEGWREEANKWVAGEGVTNQGRVRSQNIASREEDGLLFRSDYEIRFYKALKLLGVPFAPLPVFLRGGNEYQRIEPDFVIIKNGVVLVVEIDGKTSHPETPAEAHTRLAMLEYQGVRTVRIEASECRTQEQANAQAKRVLQFIDQIKSSK